MTGLEPGVIAAIAGTAVSAVGAIAQGNAAKKAANYNAAVGEVNAQAARRDAKENARRQRRLNRKAAGTIRNKEGFSMDVLEDNVREGELAALDLIHGGEVKAIGFEQGAALERMRGKAAQRAGYFSAAGTLLKGGSSLSGSFNSSGNVSAAGMGDTPGTSYGTG